MRLVEAERNGEAFDPQLVIGVRQSYGKQNILKHFIVLISSLQEGSSFR